MPFEQRKQKHLDLHIGKMLAQAHVGAAAKRHPGIFVAAAAVFRREAGGIEAFRIGPVFRDAVSHHLLAADMGAGRTDMVVEGELPQRAARHRRHRRDQPQRFLEHHVGLFHLTQRFVAEGAVPGAQGGDFGRQPILPFRMPGQAPDDRRDR